MAKSTWLKRLDLLKSIDLGSVAKEVGGSAKRMKRVLLAIHQLAGRNARWIVTVETLAAEMIAGEKTVRRAVKDLENASLIEVTRRERERRLGGQGPNEYRLCWPNLIDVAVSQGLQLSLFEQDVMREDSREEASAKETSRPDGLSGTPHSTDAVVDQAPGQNDQAPGQNDQAPGQNDRAPGQNDRALRERACARSPSLSPSLSPPPSGARGEVEDFGGRREIRQRLSAYGIANAGQAVKRATEAGWNSSAIAELLEYCERHTINRQQAFGPGAVFWVLVNLPPGSRPSVPESEAYLRAKRDREREWERRKLDDLAPKEITAEERDRQVAMLEKSPLVRPKR